MSQVVTASWQIAAVGLDPVVAGPQVVAQLAVGVDDLGTSRPSGS